MEPPESLEKIFQRVEEESERRAQTEGLLESSAVNVSSRPTSPSAEAQKIKARRRGSVSISRLGQLDNLSKKELVTSKPGTPTILTALASQSTFYQTHIINGSHDSLASEQPSDEEAHMHTEDDNHVTQVHRIAARQSISRAVGNLLPRRLSRARSRPVIAEGDGNMVIGVSVLAATATTTVEATDADPETPSATATVFAPGTLKPKASKSSLRSLSSSNDGWKAKAKDLTKIFRRKSKLVLPEPAA